MTSRVRFVLYSAVLLTAGFVAGNLTNRAAFAEVSAGQAASRVFELRTYTAPEGKLPDLQKRFRDHTTRIFQKHGMTNIGYWQPQDEPRASNTLIYIISHASREQAAANWKAFASDPEWQKVAKESQVNGRITEKIESVFMNATDYSPIK
jgi:hypothetical protein